MNVALTSEDLAIIMDRSNRFARAVVAGQFARNEMHVGSYMKAADSIMRFWADYRHECGPYYVR